MIGRPGAGQEQDKKRATFLNSAENLGQGLGTPVRATREVIGADPIVAQSDAQFESAAAATAAAQRGWDGQEPELFGRRVHGVVGEGERRSFADPAGVHQ